MNIIEKKKRRAWWIFLLIMGILAVLFGPVSLSRAGKDGLIAGILYFLFLDALTAFLIGMIPFYFYKAYLDGMKKEALQNCSFITISNLDYYRDKLTGLRPAEISLLMDLELETDKDISACIMQYEEQGFITGCDGKYYKTRTHSAPDETLCRSDNFLIECLTLGTLDENIPKWKSMVTEEAKEKGLFEDRKTFAGKTTWRTGAAIVVWLIALIAVLMPFTCISGIYPDKEAFLVQMQHNNVPEPLRNGAGMLWEAGNFIKSTMTEIDETNHAEFGEQASGYYNSPAKFLRVAVYVFFLGAAMFVILLPVLYMQKRRARINGRVPLKRTPLGEEYTELVYGMKNFIHDYSNLDEAEKEALALWDDYLIYAVVLEENKKIIEEIMQVKKGGKL